MKTLVLRKIYDYISFVRHELPNLFRVLNFDIESYSSVDAGLKVLLTAIDDEILRRQVNKYFELSSESEDDKE